MSRKDTRIRDREHNPLYHQPNGYAEAEYFEDRKKEIAYEFKHKSPREMSPEREAFGKLIWTDIHEADPEEGARWDRIDAEAWSRYKGPATRGGKDLKAEILGTRGHVTFYRYFKEYYELDEHEAVNRVYAEILAKGAHLDDVEEVAKTITSVLDTTPAYLEYLDLLAVGGNEKIQTDTPEELAEIYLEAGGDRTPENIREYLDTSYKGLNEFIRDRVKLKQGAERWKKLFDSPYKELLENVGEILDYDTVYGKYGKPFYSKNEERLTLISGIVDDLINRGDAERATADIEPFRAEILNRLKGGEATPSGPELQKTYDFLKENPPGKLPEKEIQTHGYGNLYPERFKPAVHTAKLDQWIQADEIPLRDVTIPFRYIFPKGGKKQAITEADRALLTIFSTQAIAEHPALTDDDTGPALITMSENQIIRRWYGVKGRDPTKEDREALFSHIQSLTGIFYEADYSEVARENPRIKELIKAKKLGIKKGVPLLVVSYEDTLNDDGTTTRQYTVPVLPATERHDILLGQYKAIPVQLKETPKLYAESIVTYDKNGEPVELGRLTKQAVAFLDDLKENKGIDLWSSLTVGKGKDRRKVRGLNLETSNEVAVLKNTILKSLAYGRAYNKTYTLNADTILNKVWPEGLNKNSRTIQKRNILKFLVYQLSQAEISGVIGLDVKKQRWTDVIITFSPKNKTD